MLSFKNHTITVLVYYGRIFGYTSKTRVKFNYPLKYQKTKIKKSPHVHRPFMPNCPKFYSIFNNSSVSDMTRYKVGEFEHLPGTRIITYEKRDQKKNNNDVCINFPKTVYLS